MGVEYMGLTLTSEVTVRTPSTPDATLGIASAMSHETADPVTVIAPFWANTLTLAPSVLGSLASTVHTRLERTRSSIARSESGVGRKGTISTRGATTRQAPWIPRRLMFTTRS